MRYIIAILLLLVVTTFHIDAQGTETRVGSWSGGRGSVRFSVDRSGADKSIHIFVTDEDLINTVYFVTSREKLLALRQLIDQTVQQYDQ